MFIVENASSDVMNYCCCWQIYNRYTKAGEASRHSGMRMICLYLYCTLTLQMYYDDGDIGIDIDVDIGYIDIGDTVLILVFDIGGRRLIFADPLRPCPAPPLEEYM